MSQNGVVLAAIDAFRSSKKSHHSQSYRVLIFSGEIITNKTWNHGKCAARFQRLMNLQSARANAQVALATA